LIGLLRGKLIDIKYNSVLVDCNGIGFEVLCPLNDIIKIKPEINKEIILFTHLIHRDDSMTLYGFFNEKSKEGFLNLLKVSGIGPKVALKIISHFDIDTLYKYVETEDINSLKDIPGIGLKTAKQIIFDLKGILPKFETNQVSDYEKDLIKSMINLGYKDIEIKEKIKEIRPLSGDFEKDFKNLLRKLAGK